MFLRGNAADSKKILKTEECIFHFWTGLCGMKVFMHVEYFPEKRINICKSNLQSGVQVG